MNIKSCSWALLFYALVFCSTNVFSQSRHLFSVMKSNALADDCCRVGFIDEAGKLIIDFKFYYAGEFREGLSAVVLTKGGKWGYVDESGTFAIDSQFDEATSFSDGFAKVSKDGKSFFITKAGKKAFDTSLLLLGFKDGISPAQFRGAWGFVSREGKVLIPFKFQAANPFYEGLSAVTQNNLVGYIDKSGNWVLAPRFSPISGFTDPISLPNFSEGLAVYRDKDKYGFISSDGIIVIPATFDRAETFSEGLASVRLNEKVGYLKSDGGYAIEPRFEAGGKFSNGLASIRISGKWGYVDVTGNIQILPQYDSAEAFRGPLAKVSKSDGKDGRTTVGYINKSGKLIYSWEQ